MHDESQERNFLFCDDDDVLRTLCRYCRERGMLLADQAPLPGSKFKHGSQKTTKHCSPAWIECHIGVERCTCRRY